MRNFLRFVLSSKDQARIDTSSQIIVEDVSFLQTWPQVPQPQSLRLAFRIQDPGNQAPQVYPLFPGKISFRAQKPDSGDMVLPNPDEVTFKPGSTSSWTTVGTLCVEISEKNIDIIREHAPGLAVIPTRVWYYPVKLTEEFLFQTIAGHADKPSLAKNILGTPDGHLQPNNSDIAKWRQWAVAYFLQGRYTTTACLGNIASEDDFATLPMPLVVMQDGQVNFYVTMAFRHIPHEGSKADFLGLELARNPNGDGSPFWPQHPENGAMPARLVYQKISSKLVDATTGCLLNQVLNQTAASQPWSLIKFTRTWQTTTNSGKPIVNFSPHLARQKVQIAEENKILWNDYLPAHGVVYLPPGSNPTIVSMVDGDMYWVSGQGDNWRNPGNREPILVELNSPNNLHIVLRRPMREVMLLEPAIEAKELGLCTYFSLRRVIRALIDNRITGGCYLSKKGEETKSWVQELIRMAWSSDQSGAKPEDVFGNKPDPYITANKKEDGNVILRNVLIRFFGKEDGEIASDLYQSAIREFQNSETKAKYDWIYIGKGAPGAFAFLSLVDGHSPIPFTVLAINKPELMILIPSTTDSQSTQKNIERPLKPGALIQFWCYASEYYDIQNGNVKFNSNGLPDLSYGHSVVFQGYKVDEKGEVSVNIIDHHGTSSCPFKDGKLKWRLNGEWQKPEVWIASNWRE